MRICVLYVFLSAVKRFEAPNALYKSCFYYYLIMFFSSSSCFADYDFRTCLYVRTGRYIRLTKRSGSDSQSYYRIKLCEMKIWGKCKFAQQHTDALSNTSCKHTCDMQTHSCRICQDGKQTHTRGWASLETQLCAANPFIRRYRNYKHPNCPSKGSGLSLPALHFLFGVNT